MKPLGNSSVEGRANPKGISYLYLSSDENTSLAELRPNVGQSISTAQFSILRNLKLVDCYSNSKHYTLIECLFNPPTLQEDIDCAVWSMINSSFTKPTVNVDHRSDYVPTQILTELFKSEGYDGVCFKSGVGAGFNYILFRLDDAALKSCSVMETIEVKYSFKECANRYYLK